MTAPDQPTTSRANGTSATGAAGPVSTATAAPRVEPTHRPRRRVQPETIISLGSVICLLAAWTVVTNIGWVSERTLPSPQTMASTVREFVANGYAGTPFWEHILRSLFRTLTGLTFGILLGVLVGALMGMSTKINAALMPVFGFVRPIPALAFIPLVILYFGIGEFPKILLIWIAAFLYMVLNTAAGVRAVPENYLLAAKNMGLSQIAIFTRVVLPSAVPFIMTGVKTATALSWAIVVAAELVAAQSGVGFMISDASTFFRIPYVYLGLIIIGLIGLALELATVAIEKRVTHWVAR